MESLHRGSYVSAHVKLIALNEFGKEIEREACQLYKSMNVRFYLSYDIKITMKSHFCRKTL